MIMPYSSRKEVELPNSHPSSSISWPIDDYKRQKRTLHPRRSIMSLQDHGPRKPTLRLNDYRSPLHLGRSHMPNHALPLPQSRPSIPHCPDMRSTSSRKMPRLLTIARMRPLMVFNSLPMPLRLTRSHSTSSPQMFLSSRTTRLHSSRDLYPTSNDTLSFTPELKRISVHQVLPSSLSAKTS